MRSFFFIRLILVVGCISPGVGSFDSCQGEEGLVGHWKLAGDARDSSGFNNHGTVSGTIATVAGPNGKPDGAMRFDGRRSVIQVPSSESLQLGKSDLTLSVWAQTDTSLDDAIGDLISKFDPAARRGFNWCIKNTPGVSGSQANYRHVHFGIDSSTEPRWTDYGQLGNAVFVMALAVHEGELYAATCHSGPNETGHVYRYVAGQSWADCGSPDNCNAISCLASHGGKLYAGSCRYKLGGSVLAESPNTAPGGKVFCYDGDRNWKDCGKLGELDAIGGLVTFRGEIYGTSMYRPAGLFRYNGAQEWLACPVPQGGQRAASPTVFNGALYAASYDSCSVLRFDGTAWSDPIKLEPRGQAYSLEVHGGEMYVGTWPRGHVYRSADGINWTDTGGLGKEEEVMGMSVYNGKLYGGTLPLAEVHRYDGDNQWTNTGSIDETTGVRMRRAWSMAIYQGKLFCGTLPAGHVHSLEAGHNVTSDHELKPGWRHLAVVRQLEQLWLFVDGELVASTNVRNSPALDLSNDQPLKIGFGANDYFNGALSDLRIYRRALTTNEISGLTGQDHR